MQRTHPIAEATPDAASLRFREQNDDAAEPRADATTVSFDGSMKVSSDEDSGSDPYNRTGRFKRFVR
jgi:hypothetical protein